MGSPRKYPNSHSSAVDSTVWIKGIGRTIPRPENRAAINIIFHQRYDEGAWSTWRCEYAPDYRLAGDVALAATLVSAGVAAILTSTSLTGFSVQARVT
jgi:hypothetical protein